MPSDLTANVPAELLAQIRKSIRGQDFLLITDRPLSPVPKYVTEMLSSTEILAILRPEPRHNCGLILTPWVEPEQLDSVIAHLRDFLSMEIYVLHPGDTMEQARRMSSLGLRCLQTIEAGGQSWGLNHFSLKTYKDTPSWLNNRYWANPHLWNKFRW